MNTKRHEGRDERILDPDLPIIDAHHHLFDLPGNRYMMEDFLADAYAGHKIVATVLCETQSFSLKDGPEWMRPLNEVEVANGIAALSATSQYGDCQLCAGIVGHANLTFGARIGELLDRCMAVGPDRFRGVRHVTVEYPGERPFRYIMTFKPPAGVLDSPGFAEGLRTSFKTRANVRRRGVRPVAAKARRARGSLSGPDLRARSHGVRCRG